MIDTDAVAKRLDKRVGFKLVSYREVGLPVFRFNAAITMQETSKVGAIEEFVLRAARSGIRNVEALQRFLGLPERLIQSQIGQLVYEGSLVASQSAVDSYEITMLGERQLSGASSTQLIREQVPLYVDGITRKLVAVEPRDLWTSKQLEPTGSAAIAPTPRRIPKVSDVEMASVNRVLSLMARLDRPTLRAVKIDGFIGTHSLLFRPGLALAFKSENGRDMSVAFAIDGRESEEHEVEFQRNGGPEKSALFSTLLDADKRRREIQAVARELRRDFVIDVPGVSGSKKLLSLKKHEQVAMDTKKFKTLSVYEHPPLLREALEGAKRRVLIISPWIRAAVVTEKFVKQLAACLARGVEVTIAYGISKRDPEERESDRIARESLQALTASFENFRMIRKGNTHAKVLLVDDAFFVTTSFNWLSFKGDAKLPMREEEGMMISDPSAVDEYYERMMSRMDAQ